MLMDVRLYRQFDESTVEMLFKTAPCDGLTKLDEYVGAAIVKTEFWARCPLGTVMSGEVFLDNGIGEKPTYLTFYVNKQHEDRVQVNIGKVAESTK